MTKPTRPKLEDFIEKRKSGHMRDMILSRKAQAVGGYVIIHAPLPFRIPLNDGFRYGWDDYEARYLELIHYPKPFEIQFGEPIFQENPLEQLVLPEKLHYTVARFGMPVALESYEQLTSFRAHPEASDIAANFPQEKPEVDADLGKLLDEGLEALNFLIRACRLTVGDFLEHPIESLSSLPFALMYSVWDIRETVDLAFTAACLKREDIQMTAHGRLLLHEGTLPRIETLDFETTGTIVGIASPALRNDFHPLFLAVDLLRSSVSREREGNNAGAIIDSVTGVEMLVSTIVRLDKENKGLSQKQILGTLKAGFKNLSRDHLAQPLQLGFNLREPVNALEKWFTSAYKVRNEVVHEGKKVSRQDAKRVLQQSDDLVTLLLDAMDDNPSRWIHIRPLF